jgi:hypothetical protein
LGDVELLRDKDVIESARQARESLTGQKLGPDADKWEEWWRDQEP